MIVLFSFFDIQFYFNVNMWFREAHRCKSEIMCDHHMDCAIKHDVIDVKLARCSNGF